MAESRGPIVISELPAEVAGVFKGMVADVTDPVFREHLRGILEGEVRLLAAQAAGADPAMIERGRAHTRAGLATLARVPELVLAERSGEFEAMANRVFDALFAVANTALDKVLDRYLGPPRVLEPARAAEALGAPRFPVVGTLGDDLQLTQSGAAAVASAEAGGGDGGAGNGA